jgi:hypothetical protein
VPHRNPRCRGEAPIEPVARRVSEQPALLRKRDYEYSGSDVLAEGPAGPPDWSVTY